MTDPVCGKEVTEPSESLSTDCHGKTHYFCSRACLEKFVCEPEKKLDDYVFDLIIVGGGPAGLSAGIYAGLGGLDTLFLAKSIGGQAWDSTAVRNFPGFELISGPELVALFRAQLFDSIHLAHQFLEVSRVEKEAGFFAVTAEDGKVYRSRTFLLATGMRRRRMEIPGEDTFWGRSVGPFHAMNAPKWKDRDVVVVGGGNSAAQAALGLAEAGARVTLTARKLHPDSYLMDRLGQARITQRIGLTPLRVEGGEAPEAFWARRDKTGEEERMPAQGIFVEIGLTPNSDLLKNLALVNERGEVHVDTNCRTGLPGLFAAGDVADTFGKRILIAAGEGAKAVLAVEAYLGRS